MTHTYIVESYRKGERLPTREIDARSADDAIDIVANKARGRHARQYAIYTRRWQASPLEADRDNAHAQADRNGLTGWSARRKDVVPSEAESRNDAMAPLGATFERMT